MGSTSNQTLNIMVTEHKTSWAACEIENLNLFEFEFKCLKISKIFMGPSSSKLNTSTRQDGVV